MRILATMIRLSISILALAGTSFGANVLTCWASNCARDSTGMIPLIDLGPGTYQGFEGGLYAGGLNQRPDAHQTAGVSIATSIAPLDTLGNPDAAGRVVLISIGMSNATLEFQTFVPKAMADPLKKSNVLVVDCAVSGQSADRIATPTAPYWNTVAARLRGVGSSTRQPQVVWIKEADASPSAGFPISADSLQWNLASIVRIIHQKLPNVRLCYLTSRIYAGYATSNLNPEPYAYESGFAVKWLIDSQIRGDSLNYDPGRGAVEAPWLSWGPYLWADGLNPRSDGLTWPCSYFENDGTHPAAGARDLVAESLLAFFEHDATTAPWWSGSGVSAVPTGTAGPPPFTVAPNPMLRGTRISFATRNGEPWRLEVFDLAGRRVREIARGIGTGSAAESRWDGFDNRSRRLPQGVYWIRLDAGGRCSTLRAIILDPR
jgi:hypothetical protein